MRILTLLLLVYWSAGAIMPGTDFSQWTKLRAGYEHFQSHRENADDQGAMYSLMLFMRDHFLQPDSHHHGPFKQGGHEKLPFQVIQLLISLEPEWITHLIQPPVIDDTLAANFSEQILSSRLLPTNLFRPPIFA